MDLKSIKSGSFVLPTEFAFVFLTLEENSGGRGERTCTDVCERNLVNYSALLSLDVELCLHSAVSLWYQIHCLSGIGIHAESRDS